MIDSVRIESQLPKSISYDVAVVGGSIGGATLGRTLALNGKRVLIVEKETEFRDRIRGEAIHPWGMEEAHALGIDEILRAKCGHELNTWTNYYAGFPVGSRNLRQTTPMGMPTLAFLHTEMQETLLEEADKAGAEVIRGAQVVEIQTGRAPSLTVTSGGATQNVSARLIVGADGRNSRMRKWAGLVEHTTTPRFTVASVLMEGLKAPEDRFHVFVPPRFGEAVLVFPIGDQRFRFYFVYQKNLRDRNLSGKERFQAFIDSCIEIGVPRKWFPNAKQATPLGAFTTSDSWVEKVYAPGVAVIGDAARCNDPTWGLGLSLVLRDVRVLCEQLLTQRDWELAVEQYDEIHHQYYSSIVNQEGWMAKVLYDFGLRADLARVLTIPQLLMGVAPDLIGVGPTDAISKHTPKRLLADANSGLMTIQDQPSRAA